MKFLLVEILVWLIAASVLGLIFGWLFKSLFAGRRLSKVTSDWSNRYAELKTVSAQEISALEERVSSMQSDNSTLQSKVGSLSAMVKSTETALLKANSENKALSTTVSSQKLTIDEIRVESEKLIKKQSEMQVELDELEKAREQEMGAAELRGEKAAPNSDGTGKSRVTSISSAISGVIPRMGPARDSTPTDIDAKIKNLNAQRDKLKQEREDLHDQEQHFASQLTRGDETEAYLDQTIRIDDDLTTSIQSDTSDLQGDDLLGTDATVDINDYDLANSGKSAATSTDKPKTLWDKFKASVNKASTKPGT